MEREGLRRRRGAAPRRRAGRASPRTRRCRPATIASRRISSRSTSGRCARRWASTTRRFWRFGRVDPGNHARDVLHDGAGAEAVAPRQRGVVAARPGVARDVDRRSIPGQPEERVPIGHITNGVHVRTWLAPQMHHVYDRHLGADWPQRCADPAQLGGDRPGRRRRAVGDAPDAEDAADRLRAAARGAAGRERRGESAEVVDAAAAGAQPRRADHRLRAPLRHLQARDLVLQDLERIAALVNDPQRPIQFIFAGKAHPRDTPGKGVLAADRPADARPALRRQAAVRRGLRHQRRPSPRAGRRRVAEHAAPPARGVAAPAARRSC